MKKRFISSIVVLFSTLLLVVFTTSCSNDFFDRPSEDKYSVDTFFNSDEQVTSSTNILYATPWFEYAANKAMYATAELTSGNGRTWDDDTADYMGLRVTNRKGHLTSAWGALFSVVAQANLLINSLSNLSSENLDQEGINNALGEARFIRAMAYFHIVRLWGDVPIIENNLDLIYEPKIPKNPVTDVYRFIKMDLEFAIENCFSQSETLPGKVSSEGAMALLAKVYLYEKDYTNARSLAEEVIASGAFELMPSYDDLFLTENDNNEETIMSLQWSGSGDFGEGQALQAFFAEESSGEITGTSDGWSSIGPSIDLQEAYETGDLRKTPTIMQAGNFYPKLNGGYTVTDGVNAQGTKAAVKKYVVGTPANNGGGGQMSMPNNTYLMRYADVFLIHAEAVMAGAVSTTDGAALNSVNRVRERAGLGDLTELTEDQILKERRLEFAFEGEYFFDLQRIDRSRAKAIIANQQRGTYSNDTPPVIYDEKYTADDEDFIFPIPLIEILDNPLLGEAPVPYDFN